MKTETLYALVLDGTHYKLSDRTFEDLDDALDARDEELGRHPNAIIEVVRFGDDIEGGYVSEKYVE